MKLILLALTFTCGLMAQDPFQVHVTGKGQPMILIPGLSSGGETWDTTVAHYQDRFECHVLTVAGFAGVPRVPAPMLDRVVDGLADYIRKNKLDKPIIVGHSLGGFLALDFAAKYPGLASQLVIVDSYAFYAGISDPKATPAQAKTMGAQIRQGMGYMNQEGYEAYVKSGTGDRNMVTPDSDFQRLVVWGLASDRTAVTDALAEMFAADLRPELANIKIPVLVMGAWKSYEQYTDHKRTEANLRSQYAKLHGVKIAINDTSRHFIMWDDPQWMFSQIDSFLGVR
jgi:pimeloyl-ACP methyl ester carboxylesterase